jgi:hypothetical protein
VGLFFQGKTMPITVSDQQFLDFFNLNRPSMSTARALASCGDIHAAALDAAQNASEGHVRGAIHGRDIAATRAAVQKHFPAALELEIETAKLSVLPEIPTAAELGYSKEHRVGIRARYGRQRGNDVVYLALLYAATGDKSWADAAIKQGLARARSIEPYGDEEFPAAYSWHPKAGLAQDGHNAAHRLQNWMQAWALLDNAISPEDRLEWMKIIIVAAKDRLRANRFEIPFNLTFHPLLPAFQVATAFPALKESQDWLDVMTDKLERDFSALPSTTSEGYTREGGPYHNVNTRLLCLSHLTALRGLGQELPSVSKAVSGAFAMQALFTCPDGSLYIVGDGHGMSFHEHWQDAHESLHLGAALFNRPEWKAQAGSLHGAQPELLNLWLMGPDGIDRWVKMPAIDVANRPFKSAHAPQSSFHTLRAGRGVNAHSGLLDFGTEHNHAHYDKGQILLYGLGRHLISDPGHTGYIGSDMNPLFSAKIHACAAIIRRTPMGPRTDHADYARSLGVFESPVLQAALGEHDYYENHTVQRLLALVSPWKDREEAFWLVWDKIIWKRGWPAHANEPFEMIDTNFPFHAPGCAAKASIDLLTAWSQYDGPDGAPYAADAPTRKELREHHEMSDSDANLQITALPASGKSVCDVVINAGATASAGDGYYPRPVASFRWRGLLPHLASYVLLPFRGVRDTPCATATGQTSADGLEAQVAHPLGNVEVSISGLSSKKIQGAVRVK